MKTLTSYKLPTLLKILLFFILVIHFSFNSYVGKVTQSRAFEYEAFKVFLSEPTIFRGLTSGDSIISSTSNDAFEQNAGFFYFKTGIRLSYLFNAGIIWPNFSQCVSNPTCDLDAPAPLLVSTLPNITRSFADDKEWANIAMKQMKNGESSTWFMNFINLGNQNAIGFIVPFSNPILDSLVDYSRIHVRFISKDRNSLHPLIGGECLKSSFYEMQVGTFLVRDYVLKNETSLRKVSDLTVSTC